MHHPSAPLKINHVHKSNHHTIKSNHMCKNLQSPNTCGVFKSELCKKSNYPTINQRATRLVLTSVALQFQQSILIKELYIFIPRTLFFENDPRHVQLAHYRNSTNMCRTYYESPQKPKINSSAH